MSQDYVRDHGEPGRRAEPRVPLHPDRRLVHLVGRLPTRWQAGTHRLLDPTARWLRIPAGVLLVAAGCLFILPVFGIWMIPLGLILLAEDLALLRRSRTRILDWIEFRRPHWFADRSDKEET